MDKTDILERVRRYAVAWSINDRVVSGEPMDLLREAFGSPNSRPETVLATIFPSQKRTGAKIMMEVYGVLAGITGCGPTIRSSLLLKGLDAIKATRTKPTKGRAHPCTLDPVTLRHDPSRDTRPLAQVIEEGYTGRRSNPVTDIAGF